MQVQCKQKRSTIFNNFLRFFYTRRLAIRQVFLLEVRLQKFKNSTKSYYTSFTLDSCNRDRNLHDRQALNNWKPKNKYQD